MVGRPYCHFFRVAGSAIRPVSGGASPLRLTQAMPARGAPSAPFPAVNTAPRASPLRRRTGTIRPVFPFPHRLPPLRQKAAQAELPFSLRCFSLIPSENRVLPYAPADPQGLRPAEQLSCNRAIGGFEPLRGSRTGSSARRGIPQPLLLSAATEVLRSFPLLAAGRTSSLETATERKDPLPISEKRRPDRRIEPPAEAAWLAALALVQH